MRTYAHARARMRTHADVCRQMQTYADVCSQAVFALTIRDAFGNSLRAAAADHADAAACPAAACGPAAACRTLSLSYSMAPDVNVSLSLYPPTSPLGSSSFPELFSSPLSAHASASSRVPATVPATGPATGPLSTTSRPSGSQRAPPDGEVYTVVKFTSYTAGCWPGTRVTCFTGTKI